LDKTCQQNVCNSLKKPRSKRSIDVDPMNWLVFYPLLMVPWVAVKSGRGINGGQIQCGRRGPGRRGCREGKRVGDRVGERLVGRVDEGLRERLGERLVERSGECLGKNLAKRLDERVSKRVGD
jgi:hypothetical protein